MILSAVAVSSLGCDQDAIVPAIKNLGHQENLLFREIIISVKDSR